MDLQPGEQLLGARLVDPNSLAAPGTVAVPKGLEEVSVLLEPQRVMGGQLKAGDTVGIYVSYKLDEAAGADAPVNADIKGFKEFTRLAFQQVLVTSVQQAPAEAGSGAATDGWHCPRDRSTSRWPGTMRMLPKSSSLPSSARSGFPRNRPIRKTRQPVRSQWARHPDEPLCGSATAAQDFQRKVQLAVKGALHGSVQVLPPSVILGGPQELFDRLTGEPPEVLVLGPGLPESHFLKLATVFDLQFPEVSVVLVEDTAPDLVLLAMRAGIRDILSPAADAAQIRILLERACQSFASRPLHGRPGAGAQGDWSSAFSPPRAASAKPPSPPTSPSAWARSRRWAS